MAPNAADRKSVRRLEKASVIADRANREAICAIMATTPGRAWMWDKLTFGRIFSDPFTADALSEAYHKGIRAFAMMLLSDIMAHCPEQYIQMTREANDRAITDRIVAERLEHTDGGDTESFSGRDPVGREPDLDFAVDPGHDIYGAEPEADGIARA